MTATIFSLLGVQNLLWRTLDCLGYGTRQLPNLQLRDLHVASDVLNPCLDKCGFCGVHEGKAGCVVPCLPGGQSFNRAQMI